MYGNPCLHAACKSMFCELLWFRVVVLLGEFGQRLDRLLAALIGAMWSNAKPKLHSYVIERYGRPVGTRTPDLYRVNNLQDRGDCQNTRKSCKTYFLWVGLWVGNPGTKCAAIRRRDSRVGCRTISFGIGEIRPTN